MCARPLRRSSAWHPPGGRQRFGPFAAAAIAVALAASPAMAQQGAAGSLGDPVTGEPAQIVVPPPPSYGDGAAVDEADFGEDAGATPGEIQTRLRALDATWQTLATTGGPNWMNFVIALVGGGLQIGLGAWMATQPPPFDTLAPMLITFGGVGLVSPLLRLILRPDARGPALRYQMMPDTSRTEALARIRYGEQQLESYANAFFIMRMIDASVSVASSAVMAGVTIYFFGFDSGDPLSYLLLLAPAITLINGIIEFASPSAAERRWAMYKRIRDQLRARRLAGEDVSELDVEAPSYTGSRFTFGAAPDATGTGGFAVLGGTF